ncbi:MAG: SDR family oxidoreductase [Ruminococcaceae bacterium]|mgnify:CR=1 FL=1|nr:SDR family oxidoreductase [Oscillospiraceae bacterium]
MGRTALITGASSGIGYELAKLFAQDGYDLILVARSEKRLNALKTALENQYDVQGTVIVQDLAKENAAQAVYDAVEAAGLTVDVLVNDAGFGDYGRYANTDWDKQQRMVHVNILALMQMTRLFLPQMLQRGRGGILNLASLAAFFPGPYMSVYYASKAFVLSFTEALSAELAGSGVTVTAVCPGPTTTGFEAASGPGTAKLFSALKNATAGEVALFAWHALLCGKPVAIYGGLNRAFIFGARFAPRSAIRAVVKMIQGP